MAITYFPLAINVSQIVGSAVKRARLLIATNLPEGTPLAYGDEIAVPGGIYSLAGGVGEVTLPTQTGVTNLDGDTLQYIVTGEYSVDGAVKLLDPIYIDAPTSTAAVNLASFVGVTSVPPTFMGATVAQLQAKVDEAEAARDATLAAKDYIDGVIITDLGTTDGQTKALIEAGASETRAALNVAIGRGANLGRFNARARAGRPVKVVATGDSILEGTTVTSGGGTLGVDDTLSKVATAIAARFGCTVTKANHALSGHTMAMSPLSLKWKAAIAEEADLYLVGYKANDSAALRYSTPVPGYNPDAFAAAMERYFREIRSKVPKADIAWLNYGDYNTPTTSAENIALAVYEERARDVCAAYGVEFIDATDLFRAPDGVAPKSAFYSDSIHPNKDGHAALASRVMEHLPASRAGGTPSLTAVSTVGLFNPERVKTSAGQDAGADFLHVPTAAKWVETGTWTDSGTARTTSTPGDKIAGTLTATEIYALVDTSEAADLHATLKVDGVTVFTNQAFDARPSGLYWVPLVTGLSSATHTYELILVSGTLTVDRLGWLTASGGGNYNADIYDWVIHDSGDLALTAPVPTNGSTLTPLPGGSVWIDLPAGWNSADLELPEAWLYFRIVGATATHREIKIRLLYDAVDTRLSDFFLTVQPVAAGSHYVAINLNAVIPVTTTHKLLAVQVALNSTDKTSVYLKAFRVRGRLIRRS